MAEELKIGDEFPNLELEDQTETVQRIPEDTKKVFFIADMSASKIVNSVLEEKKSEYLPSFHSVLISDIHRMPGLITKFVALPKMRGYPYRIYLIRDDRTGVPFPKEKEKITMIVLKKGIVQRIQFLSTQEELIQAIESK